MILFFRPFYDGSSSNFQLHRRKYERKQTLFDYSLEMETRPYIKNYQVT